MAFRRSELLHGAWVSWLTFVTLMSVTLVVAAVVSDLVSTIRDGAQPWGVSLLVIALPMALAIGGPVAGLVVLALLPVVAAMARRLARVGSVRVHVAVYASLGAAIGLVACVVWITATGGSWSDLAVFWWGVLTVMAVCAASVAHGWWRAMRRALYPPRRTPHDPDAQAEDALAG